MSLLLSGCGVRHLLVEAHPGTSTHPKARGVSARSRRSSGAGWSGMPPACRSSRSPCATPLPGGWTPNSPTPTAGHGC
ncbi:hypothetical protein ACIRYZ_12835 [Kitasatospora sp. NPDC101155]|uniref:hypothetical protein n=1 Tax=Kitasatospora sp. NPDC101155 TaxID=3364097 RepID=UPI003805F050